MQNTNFVMKKIYFLFLCCVFCQIVKAQTSINNNSYALAYTRDGGQNCRGGNESCGTEQKSALHNNQAYDALGDLWFDKYGRVMVEFNKSSLSIAMQKDIYEDGLFSLPNGWLLSDFILVDKNLKGVAEEISPGEYTVIEKERTVLIILGKLH